LDKEVTGSGGVYVSGATFTKTGGTISENTASYGGGVYLYVYSDSVTFTMKGGTIRENKATGGNGGGVYASGSVIFTMSSNAAITGNTASANGGGVYVNETFTMTSGTVSGNAAVLGGGVYNGGTFTMNGGTISGNTAVLGGGVYVNGSATFSKKEGGIVYGSDEANASLKNTASSTGGVPGKNGDAVMLYRTAYYYRNEDLTGADNISTDTLPANSGQTAGNWTKR
jgi:hypothetical protein